LDEKLFLQEVKKWFISLTNTYDAEKETLLVRRYKFAQKIERKAISFSQLEASSIQ